MQALIPKIKEVPENGAVRIAPNLIVWKEGSSYDPKVTHRQFDDLEKLFEDQQGAPYYIVDLSVAGRPTPEIVQIIEERLKPVKDKFKHVAVYTGNNYLMYLGIKFYFIRFEFPSYAPHTSLSSALKSFS